MMFKADGFLFVFIFLFIGVVGGKHGLGKTGRFVTMERCIKMGGHEYRNSSKCYLEITMSVTDQVHNEVHTSKTQQE